MQSAQMYTPSSPKFLHRMCAAFNPHVLHLEEHWRHSDVMCAMRCSYMNFLKRESSEHNKKKMVVPSLA